MRLHAIPHSTNVERVALALGIKGVTDVEWVVHDPADRSALVELSGQELVPVVEVDGREALLAGRDFLFGDAPGAADVCAYPFLRFAVSSDPEDDDLFHGVLIEHLALGGAFPRLEAWVSRMGSLPQASPPGSLRG